MREFNRKEREAGCKERKENSASFAARFALFAVKALNQQPREAELSSQTCG
jgi:hypothetical protein